jgi:hypothetical protein
MGQIIVETTITAEPERVFAALSDFPHAAERIPGITAIEMLTDGPVGIGTRFRETRRMFGKEATEAMEVTAFEPGRSYVLEAVSCGCRYRTKVSCAAAGPATTVRMATETTPLSAVAKVTAPVMGLLMKGVFRKCLEADLAAIQAYVSTPQAPAH